jgi:hypothetical protein
MVIREPHPSLLGTDVTAAVYALIRLGTGAVAEVAPAP